jgi:hypothetical protein
MKVCLSDHQSVCVSPTNNFRTAIQVDLDAIIFNPISSAILKWLRFKVVNCRHDFQPCTAMVWDCLIVVLLCLHHKQSLADVTMATEYLQENKAENFQ